MLVLVIFTTILLQHGICQGQMFPPDPRDSPPFSPSGTINFGDIVLTPEQIAATKLGSVAFNAVIGQHYRWKDATIPYIFDCSLENLPLAIDAVHAAMRQWEQKTCIRFVPFTNQKFHLTIFRNTHCWGNLGQVSFSHLSVGPNCEWEHVMAHELGHVVGLQHEHQRKDRDEWVKVHWENIKDYFKDQFVIVNYTDPLGVKYDYESIMHYPWTAFTGNGKITMEPLKDSKGKKPYVEISKSDIELVSRMYNCTEIERRRTDAHRIRKRIGKYEPSKLDGGGMKTVHSTEEPGRTTTPTYPPRTFPTFPPRKKGDYHSWPNYNYLGTGMRCFDVRKQCKEWAKKGGCKRNPIWMIQHCRKSCPNARCDRTVLKPPGKCNKPLGLSVGLNGKYKIPDSAFSASSSLSLGDGWKASPQNARLYFEDDYTTRRAGAWCAAGKRKLHRLDVDLGETKTITYIATQGRDQHYERTSRFMIKYSNDGKSFTTFKENGKNRVFFGNCDHVTPVLNKFKNNIRARYIRYIPIKSNVPCVRMEFYGC